jgi:hypothetical protein
MAPGTRRILFLAALIVVYLAGFIPTWLKVRDQTAQREKAEHALTLMRIVKDLGSATIDARRAQYEPARLEASAFLTAVRYEIDAGDKSALTRQQRDALAPFLAPRDELITLLARNDPAAADRLSTLYVAVRKIVGV